MSKLYFLVPEVSLAQRIVSELKAAGLSEQDMGVVARDPRLLVDLPEAQAEDLARADSVVARGALAGGASGLLAGLVAAVTPGGLVVGGAMLAGMALAGGAFGAWLSGMVGESVSGDEVAEFELAMDDGALLMIVHSAELGREKVKRIVADQHPEVIFGGEDHAVPPVV